jgi:hypothetical protein
MREYVSSDGTDTQDESAPVSFGLDGETFVVDNLSAGPIAELAQMMSSMTGEDVDGIRSIAFIADFFKLILDPLVYRRFMNHTRKYKTRPEVFMNIIQGVFEDLTDRPTVPQSDYSDGLRNITPRLTADLPPTVAHRLEGRPDLQLAVLAAQEAM